MELMESGTVFMWPRKRMTTDTDADADIHTGTGTGMDMHTDTDTDMQVTRKVDITDPTVFRVTVPHSLLPRGIRTSAQVQTWGFRASMYRLQRVIGRDHRFCVGYGVGDGVGSVEYWSGDDACE